MNNSKEPVPIRLWRIQIENVLKNMPRSSQPLIVKAASKIHSEFITKDFRGKMTFLVHALTWVARKVAHKAKTKTFTVLSNALSTDLFARSAQTNTNQDRILMAISCSGGLGDLIIYASFIRRLYEELHFPRIHVFYPIFSHAKFVFNRVGFVENVIHPWYLEALKEKYDILITLNQFVTYEVINPWKALQIQPRALNLSAEATAQADKYRAYLDRHPYLDGLFANHATLHLKKNRYEILGYFGGIDFDQTYQAYLCPEVNEYTYLTDVLGLKGKRYIVIHDGWDIHYTHNYMIKNAATKCWPKSHWEMFIRILKERCPDILIVQVGAKTSAPLVGADVCLINKTSLDQVAWILKHALLHVDSESGLVHLARTLHTKSLVLFGPTNADYFSYEDNINVRPGECGNCWWTTEDWMARCPIGLKEPACMESITPMEVADAAIKHFRSLRAEKFVVVDSRLYDTELMKENQNILEDIFVKCGLKQVPISSHAQSKESGLYIHASKQWEYLFILGVMDKYAPVQDASLRIADLGGGRGALAAYLAKLGHNVTVYDIDYLWDHGGDLMMEQRYMAWAKAHGYKAEYGSLFNVPANDQEFDVVVCVSVLEHVPFKFFALKEALRILKPGGLFIMTFDFVLDNVQAGVDISRIEIFTPELLRKTLNELNIPFSLFGSDAIEQSAERIQADQVLGISKGMTVGGLAIRKQASLSAL